MTKVRGWCKLCRLKSKATAKCGHPTYYEMSRADPVFSYIKARDKTPLDLKWFDKHFEEGCRAFFGVRVDHTGHLLSDDQQPGFFEDWQRYF